MPHDSLSIAQRIQEFGYIGYAWIVVLSLFAGTVRYLTGLNGKPPKLFAWIVEMLVSGFVGLLTGLLCYYYEIDPILMLVIVGVSAHNGTRSIYLLTEILKKNSSTLNGIASEPQVQSSGLMAKKTEKDNGNNN
ncbi:TMhelix containing protein [Vibrio phage 1.184.A._10N.286.49.A5]|nr:TMhelix containing protein [Vibrio phage 1.184.A._10N.286.49.A5]